MKPLTRKEFFMAKAAGQSVPDLEPITREEYFLNQIAESGGGGGGSSDPYGDYDLVWKFDVHNFDSLAANQMHLVKGSYESAVEKATQRYPITALAFFDLGDSYTIHEIITFRTDYVKYTEYVPVGENPFIEFRFYNAAQNKTILFFYYQNGDIVFD